MSNEMKDWIQSLKDESLDEKLIRLIMYITELHKENELSQSNYRFLYDFIVEIKNDVERMGIK
jgi:hypothetical protein